MLCNKVFIWFGIGNMIYTHMQVLLAAQIHNSSHSHEKLVENESRVILTFDLQYLQDEILK